jgi:hypothetical protein
VRRSEQKLAARRRAGEQLSLLCACGKKPIELKTFGCCHACYDRRQHSLRCFGGLRERVLKRDRYRCRACGARGHLVVHHRDRSNAPALLVTLCIRCHTRIHCGSGLRHWLAGTLLRLWRELHRRDPVQLQLVLSNAAKKDSVGPGSVGTMSLFRSQRGIITEVAKDLLL